MWFDKDGKLRGNKDEGSVMKKPLGLITLPKSVEYSQYLSITGCEIHISPTDIVLNKYSHYIINRMIKKILQGTDYSIVGEYSPTNFRWHYHGILKIKDISKMDNIRRKLNKQIGRTDHMMIRDAEGYVKYMYKMYNTKYVMDTEQPWVKTSQISNI